MTRDEIDDLMRDNGIVVVGEAVYALVQLVIEVERERAKWDGIHTCHDQCQRPACVAIREAVAAEREECAKVCEGLTIITPEWQLDQHYNQAVRHCAAAIRARGQV